LVSRPVPTDDLAGKTDWWLGLLYLLAAQVTNAVGITVAHYAFASTDVFLGTTLRIIPSFLVLLVFILWRHPPGEGRRIVPYDRIRGLVTASLIGSFLGLVLMSVGLKYTKAGIAAALNSTSPVWAVPISHFFASEKVRGKSLACVLLAMAGVVLIFI
jgi:drug/metabolite transporter (DMT)-like permease